MKIKYKPAKPAKVDTEKQTVSPLTEKELRVGREIQARKQYEREFGLESRLKNRVRAVGITSDK